MHYLIQRYISGKKRIESRPPVMVTEEEFIRLLVASGESLEKAQQTAKIVKGLGSLLEINNEFVGIKETH